MHIEVLVEDESGQKALTVLLPKLIGKEGNPHTWRIHGYKGIGHLPKDLRPGIDPAKRILLDQLPRLLRGYGKTPGVDAVVVVLDSDKRDCAQFLMELERLANHCQPTPHTLFRLAVEEIEAWYLGDRAALLEAYPNAKMDVPNRYVQDSICNTWELLADAVVPKGVAAIKAAGWPLPGQLKHEWAGKIAPLIDPDRNISPSFGKLRDGVRRLMDPGAR